MPRISRPVTTRDVAARAGVSQPTVSLVLTGNPEARVSERTRQRVLQAAEELGYTPNVLARGLARRRSYALGLIVPDLRNPFFTEVVSGAERVAAEEGYAVLLCEAREVAAARHLETLRSRQIDGVIVDAIAARELGEALGGVNAVLVDEPSERWASVSSDAHAAGRLAAEHLLGLGHRRLAFVGPAYDVHAFRQRERGFVQALRAAGVSLGSADLQRAAPTAAGGEAAMRTLLARRPRPTAVFCASDLLALGALKACAAARLRVPADVSVMGCEDIEMARLVTPELSTIAVPARELGARAARLLVRLLEAQETLAPGARRLLPVRLVARGSTGPAPAGDA